jgi:DNA-binding XRE family transcriptional regulator
MEKVLKRIQQEKGLTDSAMANKLGISRTFWNQVKNERKIMSLKLQKRAIRIFPDYPGLKDIFLS